MVWRVESDDAVAGELDAVERQRLLAAGVGRERHVVAVLERRVWPPTSTVTEELRVTW